MKITSKSKVAAMVAGLAIATSMLSLAPIASAASLTTAQVQSILTMISAFGADSATIANVNAALTGGAVTTTTTGGTTSSYTYTKNLTIGSTGADVTALQNFLIGNGNTIAAGATGYFGAQTKAALAAYQAAKGITPAVGYFGPITMASINAQGGTTTTTGGTTTTTTTTNTALTGTGRLTSVGSLGNVTSDIKEGGATVQVIGLSADATGGDVAIQRVDTTFTIGGTTGSSNLDRYVSDISLYLDGTKLASVDPATGDKDGRVWTIRFSGLNGVIKSGQTGNLYVKVTPLTSIGVNETGVTVTAAFAADSIRGAAADGISDTYGAVVTQGFTVSTMTTGVLTTSAAVDNPAASQVAVSSSTTTGVKLLTFTLKAKNQNITLTDVPVQLGTSDSLSDVISTVYLMKGSTQLSSKTVSTGAFGTTTFTNINQTINKDDTVTYSIVADLKGDAAYADGTTLVASTTVYGWDISDANGASITPSAPVTGNTMTLTATGISVVRGTPTISSVIGVSGAGDVATANIPFTVTAGDTAVYIGRVLTKGAAGDAVTGIVYATTTTSTLGATGEPTVNLSAANSETNDAAGGFYIAANTARTFTFTANIIATTTGTVLSGNVGFIINSIGYGITSTTDTAYTSNLSTFKTADVFVRKN
ncbi:MAG: peptidoglycan-binding protein [Candidatus Paceibacterota bacterium]|jgi:hypothetical protein